MTAPKPVPDGYTAVTPWIITHDTAQLLDFITQAFGGVEKARLQGKDGRIEHAEIAVGGAMVMAFDAPPNWPPSTPAFLRLYVVDGDAVFARALAAGAEPVTNMTERAWGDRVGRVRDPLGNVWWIQTRVHEFTEDEIGRRMALPEFQQAMAYVQSADLLKR